MLALLVLRSDKNNIVLIQLIQSKKAYKKQKDANINLWSVFIHGC